MVRLYAVDTAALAPRFEALLMHVDADRRARVLRLGNTPSGRRCLGAGLLVAHLAGGADALAGRLGRNAFGKPYIDGFGPFSLSHAGDYAVMATADRAVGVDIERLRPVDPFVLAARFFHLQEEAYLRTCADPQSDFFTIWTLKESYLKAEGCGFSRSPRTFAVLPDQQGGAVPGWDTDYRFFRHNDALPGCRLAVCARDEAFCAPVETVVF